MAAPKKQFPQGGLDRLKKQETTMTILPQNNNFANQDDPMDLDQLISQGGTAEKKLGVLVGHNLGSNTLLLKVPMHEFYELSEVANERGLTSRPEFEDNIIAQRNLDPKHAQKLAIYILKGLAHALATKYEREGRGPVAALEKIQKNLGKQPYLAMQPITANIRECEFGGKGLRTQVGEGGLVYVYLATKHVLWVVDGQHRRFAMQMLFDFLRSLTTTYKYPKRPNLYSGEDDRIETEELRVWMDIFDTARTNCTVMIEVHLGLTPDQERQLFHDLNNLTKKVEASLAFQFDQSNPVNVWIKEELNDSGLLTAQIVERDVTDWHEDKGYIARKDLIAVNAILFLNKTNVSGAQPVDVVEKSEFAARFWAAVCQIDGFGEDRAKQKTIAAQPVVLKALAKLAYDFGYGRQKSDESLSMLIEGIPTVNFSHDEPMWRYYQLSTDDRAKWGLSGLGEYLPS
ncbi:MAG TPA: DNA sulfur modification protein DndB, partial [Verrucomicrobiae bacterium]|nr:DNA sulfur modification protein DndB [Verrucomicrobiae bacterium]